MSSTEDTQNQNTELRWSDLGWTAEIVEDEDGGGWALAMTVDGTEDHVIVVPWVMGRNKKDPKPLNESDFRTQVKAANDFLTRTQNQLRRAHRVSVDLADLDGDYVRVVFDMVFDPAGGEEEPEGLLVATDRNGEELARETVPAGLKLTRGIAQRWVHAGYGSLDDEADGSW